MRNWFYIKDDEKIGPIEEPELCEMLEVGVLDPDVKVWTKGLEDWAPAKDVNVFDFLDDLPPPLIPTEDSPPIDDPSGSSGKTSLLAISSLVLGVLSFVFLGLFGSIPAVICGEMARPKIKKSEGALKGARIASAGRILGYFNIVLVAVFFIFSDQIKESLGGETEELGRGSYLQENQ